MTITRKRTAAADAQATPASAKRATAAKPATPRSTTTQPKAIKATEAKPASAAASASGNILGIDIGGTGLKASVVSPKGKLLTDKVRVATPYPCPPEVMVKALLELVAPLPACERIAIGFPGVVRAGQVLTAPHFGTEHWAGFPLAKALGDGLGGVPARLINDAEMQGLAVIHGTGLELVITLGTGLGSALFRAGDLMPHMELAQHTAHKGKTYNEYVGDHAKHSIGEKRWHKRVHRVIEMLDSLLHFDRLYIGGGNAAHLQAAELPPHVTLVSNDAGIEGAAALWRLPELPETPPARHAAAAGHASQDE